MEKVKGKRKLADAKSRFETYKTEAKKAAKELDYAKKFLDQIDHAKTIAEIEHIMVTARHERFDS